MNTISPKLLNAYDWAFKDHDSAINPGEIEDQVKLHSESLSSIDEKLEFLMNMMSHKNKQIAGHAFSLLQDINRSSLGKPEILEKVSEAASGLTSDHRGKLNVNLPDREKLELLQLLLPYDSKNNPAYYEKNRQDLKNGLTGLFSNEEGVIPDDIGHSLDAGNFVEFEILSRGLKSVKSENMKFMGICLKVDSKEDGFSILQLGSANANAESEIEKLEDGQSELFVVHAANHFSSMLVEKQGDAMHVKVFNSKLDKSDSHLYKNIADSLGLVNYTLTCCGDEFQAQNDCAIHVYEFFRECVNDKNENTFNDLYDQYRQRIIAENGVESENSKQASENRRCKMIMDILRKSD